MPVDPRRVQEVFLSAVEHQDPAARIAVLDRECGDDRELRRRVESLLRAHDTPDDFLDRPIVGPAGPAGPVLPGPGEGAGRRTGSGFIRRRIPCPATGVRSSSALTGARASCRAGSPRSVDRLVQAAPEDRRRGHGRRLHGRAGGTRPTPGRAQDHQAGHGFGTGHRPVRGRTPGPGPDGSPEHRPRPRRGDDRRRPPFLRDGAGARECRSPSTATATSSPRRSGSNCSSPFARRSSMRIRRGSSTATSSRRTSWSRSTTASPSPR